MEAPQMRGVEEPLLPERCAVEGGATQSEGAIETQERRYPRLHKRAGLRGLDVWAEISNWHHPGALTGYRRGCPYPGRRGLAVPDVRHRRSVRRLHGAAHPDLRLDQPPAADLPGLRRG